MKVVILAGGHGMRLREETEYKPKPMILIGNKPILWHIMKVYINFGFNDFIICLGYKGHQIKSYFLNYEYLTNDISIEIGTPHKEAKCLDGGKEKFKVTLVDTGYGNMTGSRVKQIEKYITGDNFLLTYGDTIANVNIDKLVEFHQSHNKIGTITGVIPRSRYGILEIDESRVVEFTEKPRFHMESVNGGFFVFKKEIFNYLNDDSLLVFEKEPLSKLARESELMIHKHEGFWYGMDTIRDLNYLNDLWTNNKAPWKSWQ